MEEEDPKFVTTKQGVKLCYEISGPDGAPVIALVNGWTEQQAAWRTEFIDGLVKGGFRVLRFDNRDIGYSQSFESHNSLQHFCRFATLLFTFFYVPPYTLWDMADDLHGLLECLDIKTPVHVFGFSMGGCISQCFALKYPKQTASLTLFGTWWGTAIDNPSAAAIIRSVKPKSNTTKDIVEAVLPIHVLMESPAFPTEETALKKRVAFLVTRAKAAASPPDGYIRQFLALYANNGANPTQLKGITCPTLVLVGCSDRMVLPENSDVLIANIPHAKSKKYEGIGHSFPPQFMETMTGDIVQHVQEAMCDSHHLKNDDTHNRI